MWSPTARSMASASISAPRRLRVSGREYRLVPVTQMEAILQGLERKDYDVAIGAITITPARLARVDFSYPTHRRGPRLRPSKTPDPWPPWPATARFSASLPHRIVLSFALLIVMGVAMWLAERPVQPHSHEFGRRHFARWRLLGGRDDDDGRLWRQDAQDRSRAGLSRSRGCSPASRSIRSCRPRSCQTTTAERVVGGTSSDRSEPGRQAAGRGRPFVGSGISGRAAFALRALRRARRRS